MIPSLKWMCVGLCAFVAPACQRYARQPLDLPAHHAVVLARDPASVDVAAYARRIQSATSTTQPVRYDPADGLTLDEAELVALVFNPQLRVARLKANVPRVGAAEAGRWEDPELGIDAERIIESVEHPWVLGGLLSFTIPLSGRLGLERDKALGEATAEELRAVAEERKLLAELRSEWLEWSALQERIALTRELIVQLDDAIERTERLRKAGELDVLDARLFQVERVNQMAKLQADEADARAAELALKARMGLAPTAGVTLIASLAAAAPSGLSEGDLPTVLADHPRVRVARAEYEVAERTLRVEIRRQYPDLKLGGGFGREDGEDRVLFGAEVPLPVLNANRRAIAEARAGRDVARAAAESEYEQLWSEAVVARQRLDAAEARVKFVEAELAPVADRQVGDVRRLAKLGEFNSLVLLEAVKTAHEAKLEVLGARRDAAVAARRLQSLLEGPLLNAREERR